MLCPNCSCCDDLIDSQARIERLRRVAAAAFRTIHPDVSDACERELRAALDALQPDDLGGEE